MQNTCHGMTLTSPETVIHVIAGNLTELKYNPDKDTVCGFKFTPGIMISLLLHFKIAI